MNTKYFDLINQTFYFPQEEFTLNKDSSEYKLMGDIKGLDHVDLGENMNIYTDVEYFVSLNYSSSYLGVKTEKKTFKEISDRHSLTEEKSVDYDFTAENSIFGDTFTEIGSNSTINILDNQSESKLDYTEESIMEDFESFDLKEFERQAREYRLEFDKRPENKPKDSKNKKGDRKDKERERDIFNKGFGKTTSKIRRKQQKEKKKLVVENTGIETSGQNISIENLINKDLLVPYLDEKVIPKLEVLKDECKFTLNEEGDRNWLINDEKLKKKC